MSIRSGTLALYTPNEDIVRTTTLAIHSNFDIRIPQKTCESLTGELASLVCIEYLWHAMTLYGLLLDLDQGKM